MKVICSRGFKARVTTCGFIMTACGYAVVMWASISRGDLQMNDRSLKANYLNKRFANMQKYRESRLQQEDSEFGFNSTGDAVMAPNTGKYDHHILGYNKSCLHSIPAVPPVSGGDRVPCLTDDILKAFTTIEELDYFKRILILTPIHNSEKHLHGFAKLLLRLNYPHHLVSVAFGEDGSSDHTLKAAETASAMLSISFSKAQVYHFNLTGQIEGDWEEVHTENNQYERRSHLAKSRNMLLKSALRDEEYVLWIDSDIGYFQPDLIQQLLSSDKDIVTASCLYIDKGTIEQGSKEFYRLFENKYKYRMRIFDKNSWRETEKSLIYQEKALMDHELMVEGYSQTKRIYLADLKAEGRVVPLDGVGGACLLVNSKVHKKGVMFPDTVYKHHLETEGLAKLAVDNGFTVWGMPFLEVFHT